MGVPVVTLAGRSARLARRREPAHAPRRAVADRRQPGRVRRHRGRARHRPASGCTRCAGSLRARMIATGITDAATFAATSPRRCAAPGASTATACGPRAAAPGGRDHCADARSAARRRARHGRTDHALRARRAARLVRGRDRLRARGAGARRARDRHRRQPRRLRAGGRAAGRAHRTHLGLRAGRRGRRAPAGEPERSTGCRRRRSSRSRSATARGAARWSVVGTASSGTCNVRRTPVLARAKRSRW